MNHKKFIQLLNLYIDGEATPVEVNEVEHQIEQDPARRRIYHEYCRIQAATRAVHHQFRTTAGLSRGEIGTGRLRATGLRPAGARPGRAPGPPFRRVLFWAGGAAAACLAMAVAFWSLPRAGAPERTLDSAEAPGVSVPTAEAPVAVAVAEPASDSYAAPLTAESRQDPYLMRTMDTLVDPFALTSAPQFTGWQERRALLGNSPTFDPARFAPAGTSSDFDPERVAEQNRKLQAILRSGIARENQGSNPPPAQGQAQGPFVPVNFRQQP